GRRDRLLGSLQKHLLLRALRTWAPQLVHTSNPAYAAVLRHSGLAPSMLALPGNIPVAPAPNGDARAWTLASIGLSGDDAASSALTGVFGSIHPGWEHGAWLAGLIDACRSRGRRLVLVQIGRAGVAGQRVWSALRDAHGAVATFAELGERSAPE